MIKSAPNFSDRLLNSTEQSNLNPSPPSAMHPALTNLEVICTISSYTQHRSLPALASTCRAFKHPALNALWRDLQSAEPLVKCLPSDLFGVYQGGATLLKPLDDRMWHTLFKYTSRVHSITVPDNRAVIDRLCLLMLSAPGSLFPNLRKLKWYADGTHCAAELLRMAFVPSLVELNMQISSASSAFLSVFSSLGTLCPYLQKMAVNFRSATDTATLSPILSPFITRPVSQLHHLHTLSVWDLGIQGIEKFVELRALESLSLDLTVSSAWNTTSSLSFPGFRNLQFLGLLTHTIMHASNFLSSLRFVRTKEIEFDFLSQGGSTTILQLFAIVQERCDNDKLESISLHGIRFKHVHAGQSIFASLYACCNLTRLLIEKICDIPMSDAELCQLAKAWPKLQVLQIKCYTFNITKIPTFHGLISLLWYCPALTSLTLLIDVTNLKDIDLKNPSGGRCNKRLEFLALGNPPIEDPVSVALIISGLFPSLKKVDLNGWDTYPASPKARRESVRLQWVLVNSIIGGFDVVRERGIEH